MRLHRIQQACRMFCVLGVLCWVMCGLSSCGWQDAQAVIALADSLDRSEHVIYDDTVALHNVIQTLNNPLGRTFKRSALGKAFYYMGRNLEDDYSQVARAAECYVAADWLKIDNPIYRGRVNSCMGRISGNYNQDSLSLLFYERALKEFSLCDDTIYFARGLLNVANSLDALCDFEKADSVLRLAAQYQLTDVYRFSVNDAFAHHFYRLNTSTSPDSIIYYLRKNPITDSWRASTLSGALYNLGQMDSAVYYATKIIHDFNIPAHKVSAYYILHKYAIQQGDILAADSIASLRMDERRKSEAKKIDSLDGIHVFEEYLQNPHPLRWVWIVMCAFVVLCIALIVGVVLYRRYAIAQIHVSIEQIVSLSAQVKEQAGEIHKHNMLHYYDEHLDKIRRKYPKPLPCWNKYNQLKKDVNPYLKNWIFALEKLNLTQRENVFCVLSFIYPQMAIEDLASSMCITKSALMVRKTRVTQKIGITSAQLDNFLYNLSPIN